MPGSPSSQIEPKQHQAITLRDYQRGAIEGVKQAFSEKEQFVLIQAATGAGKTIIFCQLIKELLSETPYLRIAVLA
ncbi:MAG: DEAD/DEAH box helicase family protein, partial [Planctomycetes bacterium]|nr:DEAD/DEAH box helicase family protein [Planctomycetota bacterium]